MSPSIISSYETGERSPSADVLLAISCLCHFSTDYLLGRNANTPENTISLDGMTEQQIKALRLLVDSIKNDK